MAISILILFYKWLTFPWSHSFEFPNLHIPTLNAVKEQKWKNQNKSECWVEFNLPNEAELRSRVSSNSVNCDNPYGRHASTKPLLYCGWGVSRSFTLRLITCLFKCHRGHDQLMLCGRLFETSCELLSLSLSDQSSRKGPLFNPPACSLPL